MSTVLLGTDGSKPSLRAENYLSNTYDPAEDEVVVVSVATVPSDVMDYLEIGDEEDPYETEVGQQFIQRAEEHAQDAEERLRAEGFDVDIVVPTGRPGREICRVAEERDVQCIVVGRRGQSSASEPLLGSVSQQVLHDADCPVNVVPFDGEL
jgi:nucleotide-binding universal stress UspA family protein